MKITYHSHNCFEFEANNKKVLTDPFILDNPIAIANPNTLIPDYIILTHGHFDHVSDVEAIAKRTGCLVIGSVEVIRGFNYKGVKNVHEMNFGGKLQVDGFSLNISMPIIVAVCPMAAMVDRQEVA